MNNYLRILGAILGLIVLSGCTTTQVGSIYRSYAEEKLAPRDIFVTIDGTGNSQISRTNAARLFEMVDAHSARKPQRELATYYAEGVGSEGEILGLAAGYGMSEDIRNGYNFLTRTYRPGDKIYMSGFSRGAYAARALGGMVAAAGIPDLSQMTAKSRTRLVRRMFRAYKTTAKKGETRQQHFARRVQRIRQVLYEAGIEPRGMGGETRIAAMAVWDTVEALGWPDYTERPDEDVGYYLLTNCNVDNIFHAVALDDNRAHSFTPIFADTPHMYEPCGEHNSPTHIEEVWFAGAHADVGGSYAPGDLIDGYLPGVSLNWMIDRLRPFDLLPANASVFEEPDGPIHDAKAFTAAYALLTRHFRSPLAYHKQAKSGGLPKVHISAIRRLAVARELDSRFAQCPRGSGTKGLPLLICGTDLEKFGFVKEMIDAQCMVATEQGFVLTDNQTCITVVGQKRSARSIWKEWVNAQSAHP